MKRTQTLTWFIALACLLTLGTATQNINQENTPTIIKDAPQADSLTESYNKYFDLENREYEQHNSNETINLSIKDGNTDDGIKALQIGAERFTIDIIACNHEHQRCSFRINGKPTGAVYVRTGTEQPNAVRLDENYVLRVDSAVFNYCNNQRFCSSHYEAYDIINITIIPTTGGP